jgi:hypothetical protein
MPSSDARVKGEWALVVFAIRLVTAPILQRLRNGNRGRPMNAEVQRVPPSFKVVKWGVPGDKLDQLAELLGLNAAQQAALKSGGDVVVAQDPKRS